MKWLGELHARHPRIVAALIAVVTLLALAGLPQVQFDDDARAVFRVDDDEFDALEEFYTDFGADDQDVYLVIDGSDLFTASALVALRQAYDAVRGVTEVESVVSLFEIHKRGPIPLMLIPYDDLTPERVAQAREQALAHPAAVGQFLSTDGKTTMIGVRLVGRDPTVSQLGPAVAKIRQAAETHLRPVGLRLRMAGHPSIRIDLLSTLRVEILKFTLLSAVISGFISLIIFRTPMAVLISVAGPLVGVIWTLGGMGWLGVKIDPLSVVLPTLVFVVGFTDAVHLVSDIQASREAGLTRREAVARAVTHLGPACLLTALTTMAGFGSLVVAQMDCIERFGLTCAAGTLVMFLAVQLVVPALACTRLGDGLVRAHRLEPFRFSTRWLEPAYRRLLLCPRSVAAISIAFTLAVFAMSLGIKSDQRWTEALPDSSETVQVTKDCNQTFGGSTFAYVVVEWPAGQELRSPEVLQVFQEVHRACQECQNLRGPFSVLTLLESIRREDQSLADQVRRLRRAPAHLLSRCYRPDLRKAVVSIHAPDIGAATLAPDFARLDARLAKIVAAHPGFRLHLTGTVVVAARNVYQMISDLARSLTLASVLIFLMITLLFRSLTLGVLSIIPNVLPQAITAGFLVWLGEPLTMTSVLTFSLCLGLSVDDTIHFLMRYREERHRRGTPRAAVLRTFRAVGGVMIATSLVLISGFLAMLISQMPGVRMFAGLSCITLLAAILGDLIMLPSLLLSLAGRKRKNRAP